MEFQQLKCFRAVAAAQNYSVAAENLGMGRTGVRLNIKELENSLSTTLFRNDPGDNNFVLTESGRILSYYADEILQLKKEATLAVQNINKESWPIRLVYNDSLMYTLIPKICDSYRMSRWGELATFRFNMRHHPETIRDLLIHNEADLGFSFQEIAGVRSIQIAREQLYALLPISHPLSHRQRVHLYELIDIPLILPNFFFLSEQNGSTQSPMATYIQNMLDAEHIHPKIFHFSGNILSRVAYVSAGLGYTIASAVPQDESMVAAIEIDNPYSTRPIYMHWPANCEMSVEASQFKDYCIDFFKNRHDTVLR